MNMSELDAKIVSLAISLLLTQVLLGLFLQIKAFWKYRILFVGFQMMVAGLLLGLIGSSAPIYIAGLFILGQIYTVFHVLRFARRDADQILLTQKAWRTQLAVGAFGLTVVALWSLQEKWDVMLGWLILAQLCTAAWFLLHSISSFRRTKPLTAHEYKSDQELPTLTVAIPARNETVELTNTLEALLENNYPKLEILVLDDCSQDNTSDIIRSFAHRGVRFLKGQKVDSKWLAKNHAYDQLMDSASGRYILFCGVDVRFDKQSLRLLMSEMLESRLGMMCVLPLRPASLDRHFLLQPMRYWRELAIPRPHKTTPPSLSTCWVADRKALQKLGGFEGLRRTIRPERFIARNFALSDQYRFVRSSQELGIISVKSLPAQWQTALRTRYPELKSRPENVLFTTLWQSTLLLGPFLAIMYGIFSADPLMIAISLTTIILLAIVHGLVFYMTTNQVRLEVVILLPVSIIMELVAINYSMWAYEYSKVLWKGRNICLPVMQVQARLSTGR